MVFSRTADHRVLFVRLTRTMIAARPFRPRQQHCGRRRRACFGVWRRVSGSRLALHGGSPHLGAASRRGAVSSVPLSSFDVAAWEAPPRYGLCRCTLAGSTPGPCWISARPVDVIMSAGHLRCRRIPRALPRTIVSVFHSGSSSGLTDAVPAVRCAASTARRPHEASLSRMIAPSSRNGHVTVDGMFAGGGVISCVRSASGNERLAVVGPRRPEGLPSGGALATTSRLSCKDVLPG